MPPYFSIEFSFERKILNPNFVRDVYNVFFNNGFLFKEGYWKDKNCSLEDIISWNQAKLDCGFRLELDQYGSENYKQILLSHKDYEHLRLFWMYMEKEIYLFFLVPESEVLIEEDTNNFIRKRVNPFIEISKKLWETGVVSLVQSCTEGDSGVSLEKVRNGIAKPTTNPFSIVSTVEKNKISNFFSSEIEITPISHDSYLIVQVERLFK